MDREALLELRQVRDELSEIAEAAIRMNKPGAMQLNDIAGVCDLIGQLAAHVRIVTWHVEELANKVSTAI